METSTTMNDLKLFHGAFNHCLELSQVLDFLEVARTPGAKITPSHLTEELNNIINKVEALIADAAKTQFLEEDEEDVREDISGGSEPVGDESV